MVAEWPEVYRKLRGMRGLTEDERILMARALAATPCERWQMNVNYLRRHGCWGSKNRRRYFALLGGSATRSAQTCGKKN